MGRQAVLALDIGTSSTRASLYDVRGRRIGRSQAQVTYSATVTADGGAELDPDVLCDHVGQTVDAILEQHRDASIAAVGISTFWHSLLGVDRRGKPLTPVYLWLDARSRAEAAALRERLDERAVHSRVGTVLHWSYWPAKLAWLRRTQPKTVNRVARWISFGELLVERLTGQRGVSVSMASGTGLLNAHTCQWDGELLEALELEPERLGTIVGLGRTGSVRDTERWPQLRDVPWLPAVGDGACSNLGAGCTTPAWFALMVGTSGAERAVWQPPDPFEIPWGTWCYRVDERRAVLGGALNDGGSLFDWLRHALKLPPLSRLNDAVADVAADSHGLTVLPFWGGERSPGWADDARGAIVGLRLHTQPIEIMRAALEGVALRFAEVDRLLLEAMPTQGDVVATGGALLHSPAWQQIMADVLGRPVLASAEPEASSRGAALLALETVGLLPDGLDALRPATRGRVEPIAENTARYRAAAARQRRLYDQLVVQTPADGGAEGAGRP